MLIRPFRAGDAPELSRLFYETIHTVNSADYTPAQLDAWAPAPPDPAALAASLLAHRAFVAELDGRLAGFADLGPGGYLDRLYVHKDCQRRGVAAALCSAVEQAAGPVRMTTHASLTARGFFERRGWRVVRRQQVERRGQLLTNFVMERVIKY